MSVVLSFVPVVVGTLLRLLCLAPYPMKLCQNTFALRGLLSFDLLFPFCKLPLILLYYALSLIVGGHERLSVGVDKSEFAGLFGFILSHHRENTRTVTAVCSAVTVNCFMNTAFIVVRCVRMKFYAFIKPFSF